VGHTGSAKGLAYQIALAKAPALRFFFQCLLLGWRGTDREVGSSGEVFTLHRLNGAGVCPKCTDGCKGSPLPVGFMR